MIERIDWFRVLANLTQAGVPNAEVSRRINVSRYKIIRWKTGSEVEYHDGAALINLHASVCPEKAICAESHKGSAVVSAREGFANFSNGGPDEADAVGRDSGQPSRRHDSTGTG